MPVERAAGSGGNRSKRRGIIVVAVVALGAAAWSSFPDRDRGTAEQTATSAGVGNGDPVDVTPLPTPNREPASAPAEGPEPIAAPSPAPVPATTPAPAASANPVADPAPPAPKAKLDPSKRSRLSVGAGGMVVGLSRPGKIRSAADLPVEEAGKTQSRALGSQGILAREVGRQAVLMAAREGLGLVTRDGTLGEPMPTPGPGGDKAPEIDVVSPAWDRVNVGLRLDRMSGTAVEEFFRLDLTPFRDDRPNDPIDLPRLVEAAERAARGPIVEALARAGLSGKAAAKGEGAVPDAAASRIEAMSAAEQFGAVRALHEAIRADGESPARLEALARAYAHLGILTEFQWDAMAKAFQARSLLYAQRLVAADPEAPRGYWVRAYAMALAGLHKPALDDLASAKALAAPGSIAPPSWADLIDASCRYDLDRLGRDGGPHPQLAATLNMFALEVPRNAVAPLRAARRAIEANPENFRAIDALCDVGGVANLHSATVIGPRVLAVLVPRKIAALPGAPDKVLNPGVGDDLPRVLDEATAAHPGPEGGEPSWSALGKVVRETRFVQTWRRIKFLVAPLSVPTGDYWQQALPLVADHPLKPFLRMYVTGAGDRVTGLKELAESTLDATDLSLSAESLLVPMGRDGLKLPVAAQINVLLYIHSDGTARDLGLAALHDSDGGLAVARLLIEMSPYSPEAISTLLAYDWDKSESRHAEWEATVGNHPAVLRARGAHRIKEGKVAEGVDLLARSLERSPDASIYKTIAKVYKDGGDLGKWRATLDRSLDETEDFGLDHAQVRVEIADALMNAGKYDDAWPYAEAAAQTWAEWAMARAIRCSIMKQDWETAETWIKRKVERYPRNSWSDWYLFCIRNGRGDKETARAQYRSYVDSIAEMQKSDEDGTPDIAMALLAAEDPAAAKDFLQTAAGRGITDFFSTSLLALMADSVHDIATRDAAVRKALDSSKPATDPLKRLLVIVAPTFAAGPDARLDPKSIDPLLATVGDKYRPNIAGYAAWILTNRGQFDDARPYWKIAAEYDDTWVWTKAVAMQVTREGKPPAWAPANRPK